VVTRRGDLNPKTLGKVRWDKRKKTAVIAVLDASDYTYTLELASLPCSEASRSSEEHTVNRLAEALVRLDRRRD
jgi:hypothetical protein